MLSVFVVPSVSVESATESAMESQMTCLMKCFLRCVFQRYDAVWSAISVLLEETAFGGNASLEPADPSIADFLEHLTAACPCPVVHAGQKCPQFCGIGRSWILNKLYFELVPQKEV